MIFHHTQTNKATTPQAVDAMIQVLEIFGGTEKLCDIVSAMVEAWMTNDDSLTLKEVTVLHPKVLLV